MILEFITGVLAYILFFFIFMHWHELMHVKGWGLGATGKEYIEKTTLQASCDTEDIDKFPEGWGFLNGGLLTAVTCYILAVLISDPFLRYCLFPGIGTLQLIYGIYEWKTPENIVWQRYLIYIGVSAIFLLGYLVWLLI